MQRLDNGSILLDSNESAAVAQVLVLSRELVTQMDASRQLGETVEYNLLTVLDLLEDLGVSSDEMTGKLDRQPKAS